MFSPVNSTWRTCPSVVGDVEAGGARAASAAGVRALHVATAGEAKKPSDDLIIVGGVYALYTQHAFAPLLLLPLDPDARPLNHLLANLKTSPERRVLPISSSMSWGLFILHFWLSHFLTSFLAFALSLATMH